ncbi:hypothetical protein [Wolbachia pipientis]|uniref:hypothetical protein n=1 Tax=Wolbachia pipientis TaxID=955 RepID=UPI0025A3B1C9|nr:hypothetical protein [Wolbachia pipientis]MDM8335758.1 hypothetical protein [Wolbachia pipientis]
MINNVTCCRNSPIINAKTPIIAPVKGVGPAPIIATRKIAVVAAARPIPIATFASAIVATQIGLRFSSFSLRSFPQIR